MFCDFQGQFKGDCGQHENCKRDIVFPADVEKCVTLKGGLLESIGGQAFGQIDRICAEPAESEYQLEIPAVYCLQI